MTTTSQHARDHLRQLVDTLPDAEIPAATRYLEYLKIAGDLLLRTLTEAPLDEEPETPEEAAAVAEAHAEVAAGRTISQDEARRRLLGR